MTGDDLGSLSLPPALGGHRDDSNSGAALVKYVLAFRDLVAAATGASDRRATELAVLCARITSPPNLWPNTWAASDMADQRSGADAIGSLYRWAAGEPNADDVRRMCAAACEYLAGAGAVPFEACMGLPLSRRAVANSLRNRALRAAALELGPDPMGPTVSSAVLAAHWDAFVTRGEWKAWRRSRKPDPTAPRLRRLLFAATLANGGRALSAKQVGRLVDDCWADKTGHEMSVDNPETDAQSLSHGGTHDGTFRCDPQSAPVGAGASKRAAG